MTLALHEGEAIASAWGISRNAADTDTNFVGENNVSGEQLRAMRADSGRDLSWSQPAI